MRQYIKTIITIAVTAAVTFSVTAITFRLSDADFKIGNGSSDRLKMKIDAINTYLEENYLYDDVNYYRANTAAIKAYVESLEEPYTHYYTKSEFEDYLSGIEESYVGIGVVISADTENDKIRVISPFYDSPAYKAGIKPGDFITGVDGEKYNSSQMDECISAIKSGEEGTSVNITVERGGKELEFTVERSEIVENSVTSEMLDNNIGYISITGFNKSADFAGNSTSSEFETEIKKLQDSGMQKLIIDLRDNPGGVLDEVCAVADYILPEGVITYTKSRNGERKDYNSDKNELDIPIAVLINENSASASEILAGALKDYDRAEIIGKQSYGKGIVQSVLPFTDGSGISMTVSEYYTPKGVSIHGVGVEPDYEVELPGELKDEHVILLPRDKDTQLQKAIEILK